MPDSEQPLRCGACRGSGFVDGLAVAFQPIVRLSTRSVLAHEALIRGSNGEGAAEVLAGVDEVNRYAFDQRCRVAAIESAAAAGIVTGGGLVSINFLPNAVYRPELCIRATLAACTRVGIPTSALVFEFTEAERTLDIEHVKGILRAYAAMGFKTAIDDFGAGFSGLALLADFQPDFIKLDMHLVRGIDADRARRAVVAGVARMAGDLGVEVIAEGIETVAEAAALADLGIDLLQGYLFARPLLGASPAINWPDMRPAVARANLTNGMVPLV